VSVRKWVNDEGHVRWQPVADAPLVRWSAGGDSWKTWSHTGSPILYRSRRRAEWKAQRRLRSLRRSNYRIIEGSEE
jgi:hypothetical protein